MTEDNSEKKKKNSAMDKLVMGAIIGGAIGSVIGASLSPKTKKEDKGIKKMFFSGLKKILKKRRDYKEIPNE